MLDQKEIDEAADRLRRHYEAIKSSETYRDSPYFVQVGRLNSWENDLVYNDESLLARAYIAEQQAKAEREACVVLDQKETDEPKPQKPRMPVCPYCKDKMEPKRYEGYYESFDYWECACENIPGAEEWRGHAC